MVEGHPQAAVSLARATDHLRRGLQLVADRLLAEHVAAGLEGLDSGVIVVAAVLVAARGHAAHVGGKRAEHGRYIREGGDAKALWRGAGPVWEKGADPHQLSQVVLLVESRMVVADGPQANNSDP